MTSRIRQSWSDPAYRQQRQRQWLRRLVSDDDGADQILSLLTRLRGKLGRPLNVAAHEAADAWRKERRRRLARGESLPRRDPWIEDWIARHAVYGRLSAAEQHELLDDVLGILKRGRS